MAARHRFRLVVRLLAVAGALVLAGTSLANFAFRDSATSTSLGMATAAVPIPASQGGGFYIADTLKHRIFKVDAAGNIAVVAGTGESGHTGDNGPATQAEIAGPTDAVPTPDGGFLIASGGLFSGGDKTVRKVSSPATGSIITTVAGGAANVDEMCDEPQRLDSFGNGCPATQAMLNTPTSAVQRSDGSIIIADLQGHVRRVDGTTGIITRIAGGPTTVDQMCPEPQRQNSIGDGCPATQALVGGASAAIPFDAAGAAVNTSAGGEGYLITEYFSCRVRHVNAAGIIRTVAGVIGQCGGSNNPAPDTGNATDLKLTNAADARPTGVPGEFLLADGNSCTIRLVNMNSNTYTTVHEDPSCNNSSIGLTAAIPEVSGEFLVANTGTAEINRANEDGTFETAAGTGQPDVNTTPPEISGTPAVGQTLTCSQGTWSHSPTSYTYQWNRDGGAIPGATGNEYVVTAVDAGHSLSCTVTATSSGQATIEGSATSASVQIPGGGGPGPGPGGGGNNPPAGVSNAFTIGGTAATAKNGNLTITVNVPGPGKVDAAATATIAGASAAKKKKKKSKKKNVSVASASATATGAGPVKLTLKPKGKAKKALKKAGKLKAKVKITYTPTGGSSNTVTKSVKFKLAKKKKKKKKK